MSGGNKHDTGKLGFSMLPPDALRELVARYDLGARKYGRANYLKGMEWHRVFDALQRHAWAWWDGETNDPEDGGHHLAAVAWAALTLLAYERRGLGTDDRIPIDAPTPPPVTITVVPTLVTNVIGAPPTHTDAIDFRTLLDAMTAVAAPYQFCRACGSPESCEARGVPCHLIKNVR